MTSKDEAADEDRAATPSRPVSADNSPTADGQLTKALELLTTANAAYLDNNFAPAEAAYRAAIQLQPDLREALYNLGVLLRDDQRFEEAKQLFQRIVDQQPAAAMAHNNLGVIAGIEGDLVAAEKHYRQAIEWRPDLALAHFNLGQLLLKLGRYEEGWRECEWRWQTPTFTPLRGNLPRWDGSQLSGTLLVHTEQGAGDTFQFARFLRQIRDKCDRVVFVCPKPLLNMFQQGDWADSVRTVGQFDMADFKCYLPLLSAPHVLGQHTENAIPAEASYLTPEDRKVELGPSHVADEQLKVGLVWGGSPTHQNDAFRSFPAGKLAHLLRVAGVACYSLQKGPQVAQLTQLSGEMSALRNLDALQHDFSDTAAIIRQLDLVITIDTSVLHLAAGLGKPVWGLLGQRADWRWLEDRTDSPWYPTLRLFRPGPAEDWDQLLQRVARELAEVVAGKVAL